MAYFPMFIDISDQLCLVTGGGKVAARKVETLLAYGAVVRVISPEVCPEIENMIIQNMDRGCSIRREALTGEDLEDEIAEACMVIAATGSRRANHEAALLCQHMDIPVNVVDAPEECNFFFPAVVKKGDISIGINTGGRSPIVSSRIRQEIQKNIPDYYDDIARQQGIIRSVYREEIPDERARRMVLREAADIAFVKRGILDPEEIEGLIEKYGG